MKETMLKLNFQQEFPVLLCPECNQDFIIIVPWNRVDGTWIDQIKIHYCPYCGAKQEAK
jgi:rubrerythrin